MRNLVMTSALGLLFVILSGCAHPMTRLRNINLGMTPADVEAEMGKPYSVRASKIFEGEQTTEVWEYWPPYISNNPQKVWVIFENGRVVQWGAPGDYSTGSAASVKEYSERKGR